MGCNHSKELSRASEKQKNVLVRWSKLEPLIKTGDLLFLHQTQIGSLHGNHTLDNDRQELNDDFNYVGIFIRRNWFEQTILKVDPRIIQSKEMNALEKPLLKSKFLKQKDLFLLEIAPQHVVDRENNRRLPRIQLTLPNERIFETHIDGEPVNLQCGVRRLGNYKSNKALAQHRMTEFLQQHLAPKQGEIVPILNGTYNGVNLSIDFYRQILLKLDINLGDESIDQNIEAADKVLDPNALMKRNVELDKGCWLELVDYVDVFSGIEKTWKQIIVENPFGWDVKAREEESLVNGIHQLTVNTKFDKEYMYTIANDKRDKTNKMATHIPIVNKDNVILEYKKTIELYDQILMYCLYYANSRDDREEIEELKAVINSLRNEMNGLILKKLAKKIVGRKSIIELTAEEGVIHNPLHGSSLPPLAAATNTTTATTGESDKRKIAHMNKEVIKKDQVDDDGKKDTRNIKLSSENGVFQNPLYTTSSGITDDETKKD
eukprot:g12138.t1